jgi:STE24 endopeptidase
MQLRALALAATLLVSAAPCALAQDTPPAVAPTTSSADAAAGPAVDAPDVTVPSDDLSTSAGVEAFDPAAATRDYLARLTPEQRERSDSYFEGGYWLILWNLLWGLAVAAILLGTRTSARMRDMGERFSRFRPVRVGVYAVLYTLAGFVLGFPLSIYQNYFREHRYGLSNQTLVEWLVDQAKGLAVGLVLGTLGIVLLYAVIRRTPRTWWLWGATVLLVLLAFAVVIAPVYIDPLFNEYEPLQDPAVRDPILRMAHAHGVPTENVWVFDASRQTNRISANVSGLFGTERIALNDNLLERTSLPEIEAVMGHELGHYVLGHIYEMFLQMGLIVVLGFAFLRLTFERVRRGWGLRWGIRGVDDPAGLPLLAALLSVWFFLMTPLVNTIVRTNEAEADAFGLAVARQPEGFAEVALKLGEYRKLDPGPVEEWLFFDHPSGRARIERAMAWKAAEGGGDPVTAPAAPEPAADEEGQAASSASGP